MKNGFKVFLTARTVSIFGDRVAGVVLPLAILAANGSALAAGLVAAALRLPAVLAALHLGALVDRFDRRTLMICADVVGAVSFVAIGAEIVLADGRLPVLVLLALLAGTAETVFSTASGSYLPKLVDEKQLMRANGLAEGSDAAATLAGPAAGGWLLQVFGPFVAFLTNAASFLTSALLLMWLPGNRPPARADVAADESLFAGLRLITHQRRQRLLLTAACYMHLLTAVAFLPLLVRMRDELGLDPETIGLVISAAGVGGLISSLYIARWCETRQWPLLLAVVLGVNGAAAGSFALLGGAGWLALAVLILDGASALAFIIVSATRQRITADHVRGRVLAAGGAVTALVRLLGIIAVGALTERFGPNPVLIGLALIGIPFILLLLTASHSSGFAAEDSETPATSRQTVGTE
ncbi:MFS transporter [Micromonospora sp. 4G57]|uniref:MFS transporter n=1 Tax=Micromonospora sicca TaxID=2202420 RepID=A0ABU5JB33_9ACTN|nr:MULTISPECIES: MFS transporter [unclassified Micromonospora]MDZ5444408.1 MFS transporter [Micromonospora sp. 4G57]MDZ5489758.1 MFS transporter [Micromonospora sp. 4G53]